MNWMRRVCRVCALNDTGKGFGTTRDVVIESGGYSIGAMMEGLTMEFVRLGPKSKNICTLLFTTMCSYRLLYTFRRIRVVKGFNASIS